MVEESSGSRQLSLAHTRTLKMTDDVLCIRISPNGELLDSVLVLQAQPSSHSLNMTDNVLCLRISPNSELVGLYFGPASSAWLTPAPSR